MQFKTFIFLFIFPNLLFCAKDKGPLGIHNQGNTCYMNSALQCLYNIGPLTNFLLQQKDTQYFKQEYKIKDSDKKVSSIPKEYINLVEKLFKRESPIEPITFCERMWPAMQSIPRTQDDSAQFIDTLIEHLSDLGVNKDFVKTRYGFPRNNIVKSYVGELFNIILKTHISCDISKCKLEVSEATIETMLRIPVIDKSDKSNLEDMLKGFFAKEKLDDSELKWKEKKEIDQFKQYKILTAPPYIILQFKIFDNFGNKITIPITFPINNLDIAPYFENTNIIEKNILSKEISLKTAFKSPISDIIASYSAEVKYDLIGVVQHSGSTLNSGHYTAYVKYNDQWYYCDDETTTPFNSINDFETKGYTQHTWGSNFNPYILFYKKQTSGISKSEITKVNEKELFKELEKFNISPKDVDDFVSSKKTPTTVQDLVNGINDGFMNLERLVSFIEDYKISRKKELQLRSNQFYSLTVSLQSLSEK